MHQRTLQFGRAAQAVQQPSSKCNNRLTATSRPHFVSRKPSVSSSSPCCTSRERQQSSVVVRASSEAVIEQPSSSASPSKTISTSSVWEIDFCSRPLLDERGKKVWELLICDPERNFEYAEYFPNNKINSAEVRVSLMLRMCRLATPADGHLCATVEEGY